MCGAIDISSLLAKTETWSYDQQFISSLLLSYPHPEIQKELYFHSCVLGRNRSQILFLTEKFLDPVSRHSPSPSDKLMQRSDFLFLTYAKQLAYSSEHSFHSCVLGRNRTCISAFGGRCLSIIRRGLKNPAPTHPDNREGREPDFLCALYDICALGRNRSRILFLTEKFLDPVSRHFALPFRANSCSVPTFSF